MSRLVIKPRFPDLPPNPIITRPSFLSLPILSIKYLTSWAMLYGKKKHSLHPAAWSRVTPPAGFETVALEPCWEITFPRPHQTAAHTCAQVLPPSLHPGTQPAPVPHITLPCSLATAPLMVFRAGIWTNPATAFCFGGASSLWWLWSGWWGWREEALEIFRAGPAVCLVIQLETNETGSQHTQGS